MEIKERNDLPDDNPLNLSEQTEPWPMAEINSTRKFMTLVASSSSADNVQRPQGEDSTRRRHLNVFKAFKQPIHLQNIEIKAIKCFIARSLLKRARC